MIKNKRLKFTVIATLSNLILCVFLISQISASEYRRTPITNITNISENQNSGIAMSMGAASIECSRTDRWQMGAGLGTFNDSTALALGGCKRFNDVLIKVTGSKDGNNTAYSASFNFTLD